MLAFLFLPGPVCALYGLTTGPSEHLLTQLIGVALLAIGVLTAFARNLSDAAALKAIVLALLISNRAGFIVDVIGTLSGTLGPFGWSGVSFYLFLALGYAYLYFSNRVTSLPEGGSVSLKRGVSGFSLCNSVLSYPKGLEQGKTCYDVFPLF